MNFVAYHDRTSADHQARFDDLFVRGFRMISLSVYGNRGDERCLECRHSKQGRLAACQCSFPFTVALLERERKPVPKRGFF